MSKEKNRHQHKSPYKGAKWIDARLPTQPKPWLECGRAGLSKERSNHRSLAAELSKVRKTEPWKWPRRPILFLCDVHADADAFSGSLVASGGIRKLGPGDDAFKLTKLGRASLFLIGGDCIDKGPSSLRVLRLVRLLKARGAKTKILAGNHDVRMLIGMRAATAGDDPRNEHFFIRMGPKLVRFLKEVWEYYLEGREGLRGVPGTSTCRRLLYPSKRWFDRFPLHAGWVMPDAAIERELKRMRTKIVRFETVCDAAGLSLRMVYAASMKWRELFLKRDGEFSWFYRHMSLTHREGSFLFLHAGLDDRIVRVINEHGLRKLEKMFRREIFADPFDFYYGPLANMIRTKYRPVDMPLTPYGARLIGDMGIHAIVHGHLNLLHGQRIMLRQGIVNFQCDASLDRHTRTREGLPGYGAAATVFLPEHKVLGISNDYPYIKSFQPGKKIRTRVQL